MRKGRRIGRHLPLAVFAFLALLVQSFVVQTHIHVPEGPGKGQTVSLITLAAAAFADMAHAAGDACLAAPRDKFPVNGDPLNCPLCQEAAHCGEYLRSAAALSLLPPSVNVHLLVLAEALPISLRASHSWRGRAPPFV